MLRVTGARCCARRRASTVNGPLAWNSLPEYSRDQAHSFEVFVLTRKLFFSLSIHNAFEDSRACRLLYALLAAFGALAALVAEIHYDSDIDIDAYIDVDNCAS